MRTIKVIHVLNSATFSGAENVAISIIKNMRINFINKYDFYYVSLIGSIKNNLANEHINYIGVKSINLVELNKVIKNIKPDIIHAHDFTTSVICSLVSPQNITLISHIHNNPPFIKSCNIRSLLYLLTVKRYSKILCVSKSIQDEYFFMPKGFLKKIKVVKNPMDFNQINLKIDKNSNSSRSYDLIFIGRLCEQKNPLKFIQIVSNLVEKKQNLKVAIIGDGELAEEVMTEIEKKHLNEIIEYMGFLENPYNILLNSKILCMTSTWEGFGLVAFEALSLKKPVVAYSVGGLPIMVNEDCGKLCITDREYLDELELLLNDADYYETKSNSAFQKSIKLTNILEYMNGLDEIYNCEET